LVVTCTESFGLSSKVWRISISVLALHRAIRKFAALKL
jgi:hypothetical protein